MLALNMFRYAASRNTVLKHDTLPIGPQREHVIAGYLVAKSKGLLKTCLDQQGKNSHASK